jgi:drug/metabolite transporter (DMT)-like permease
MRPTTLVGVLLIVLGVAMLVTGGYSYQKSDKVLDVGPVQATVQHDKRVTIPPVASGLVLAAGVALLFVGNRQRT